MADPAPQTDRSHWLLGLTAANFVVLVAAAWFVGGRLTALEEKTNKRIVALDMAFSGTSREDTDRYLAENYDLPDRAALLDEVYAAAGE
jgi:hypothetical protein